MEQDHKGKQTEEGSSPVQQQRLYYHFPGSPTAVHERPHGPGMDVKSPTARSAGSEGSSHVSPERGLAEESTLGTRGTSRPEASSHHPSKPPYAGASGFVMSRPPPPPPLTPPELSTAIFSFEEMRKSQARSAPDYDDSFFGQPNPDYMTTGMPLSTASTAAGPVTPRRRQYSKTLPVGIPSVSPSSARSFEPAFPSRRGFDPEPSSRGGFDPMDSSRSPSSFPPTAYLLPGPPPNFASDASFGSSIDLQGEIISVMDDKGAGWKRHTRVYGGGVCLACATAGDDGQGGFYGSNVRPEEKQ